jgi:hypothetical protein
MGVLMGDMRVQRRARTVTRPTAFTGRKWVRWTKKMKAAFLDHLAATCNVKESAAEIGVDPVSVYGLRRHDAEFRANWADALACGYEMLETQLVGHALAGDGSGELTGAAESVGPISVDLALRLLTAHRNAMTGKMARGGPPRHRATKAETDAAILKKLAVVEKRLGLAPLDAAAPDEGREQGA